MSREIEFRAWVNMNQQGIHRMFDVEGIDWKHNRIKTAFGEYPIIGNVLREYTGLRDKNGVKIYEGDIIEQPRTDRLFSEKTKTKLVRAVVKWWDGHSHHNYELNKEMMSKNPSWFNEQPHYTAADIEKETKFVYYEWSEFHNCEVIGNIYENDDLLADTVSE